jgi:hypothetical protein
MRSFNIQPMSKPKIIPTTRMARPCLVVTCGKRNTVHINRDGNPLTTNQDIHQVLRSIDRSDHVSAVILRGVAEGLDIQIAIVSRVSLAVEHDEMTAIDDAGLNGLRQETGILSGGTRLFRLLTLGHNLRRLRTLFT